MKLKELIEKFEERKTIIGNFQGYAVWWEDVKEIFEQLDEPQPIKIPQCVADWISFVKINGLKFKNTYGFYEEIAPSDDVYRVMYYIFKESIADKEIRKWVVDNIDTFARAWLDGYEVEEEKKYKVVMPNVSSSGGVLTRIKHNDSWIWIDTLGTIVEGRTHTRKELESNGFGWVFDCSGIEIEEVEG
jgi:hypothetical protein